MMGIIVLFLYMDGISIELFIMKDLFILELRDKMIENREKFIVIIFI